MTIKRVAYLSLHTSPLLQPGSGDAGGMNVYIDELARTMARRGVQVDVFTRAVDPNQAPVVDVVDGYRVIHIAAGPMLEVPVSQLTEFVFEFAEAVCEHAQSIGAEYDLVHSHYWLSGWAGLMVKRVLGIPLANSFHTLGRVKDVNRRPDEPVSALVRIAAETDVIHGSDCVISATKAEFDDLLHHYEADPARLCTSPPGVDHSLFSPGDQNAARRRLGLDADVPVVLFVGRIQALKGIDVVVASFDKVRATLPNARLLVVGGPSGLKGYAELEGVRTDVDVRGLSDAVQFYEPVPHGDLVDFYRSADVVIVPSRSESFGLVAAEAQSCGTPVVAAKTGGLPHVVSHDVSGALVEGWEPDAYASVLVSLLTDDDYRNRLAAGALEHSNQFSWEATANRLLELYAGIQS